MARGCDKLVGYAAVTPLGACRGTAGPKALKEEGPEARPGETLQLQDDFSGTPLSVLARLGLEVYDLIPDFRDRCPLCRGKGCPVRHGLYHRGVADQDGSYYDAFPVPRFLCRRKGPCHPEAVTFSVLPSELVSRKRFSLPLMLWILERLLVGSASINAMLEALGELFGDAQRAWRPEPQAIYRLLHLFSKVHARLRSFPVGVVTMEPGVSGLRAPSRSVLEAFGGHARASPLVLAFHRQYDHLLFDVRRGR